MASKDLNYRLTGTDVSASKTIGGVATVGEKSAHRIGGAFTKLGSQIGGEFGDVLTSVGDGFEKLGEKGTSKLAKLAAGGAALAGVGALLIGMGDKEKAASQQLDQAITNTGHTASEFKSQISATVHQMERYGDSAVTTKTALMTLTNATHDPKKAIDLMGAAADLAAARHISLDDAATQLAKGLNGSTRVFKQYGIVVGLNADGTKNYAGAIADLAKVIHGQANAAADTLTGKLRALRTEVTDGVSAFGAKYGPAITATGVGAMALAPLLDASSKALRGMGISFGFVGTEAVAGSAEVGAADARIVASNEAAAASARGMGGAQAGALARFGPAAALAAAGGLLEAKSFQAATQAGKDHGKAVGGVSAAVNLMIPGFSIATGRIDKFVGAFKRGNVTSGEGSIALDKVTQSAMGVGGSLGGAATTAAFNAAAAMHTARVQAGDLATAFTALDDKTIGVEQANIAFRDSEDAVAASVKQGGRSLSDNTAAGRANYAAVLASIQAAQAHAAAVGKQTGSLHAAGAAFDADVGALRRHLQALHLQPAAIQAIISKYGHMPKAISTKIAAEDRASAVLAAIKKREDALYDKNILIGVTTQATTISNKRAAGSAHAGGSDFFEGGALGPIAEREPEMILDRGSKIIPLSRMHGGGGSQTINLTINAPQYFAGSTQELARHLVGELERFVGAGGKLRIARGVN